MTTSPALRVLPWLLVLGMGPAACSGDDGRPVGACDRGLLPGDLVISEIMPDPPGADSGREWFEIYNASGSELDLRGVTLIHSREDGTDAKAHPVGRSWVLASDEFGVAGSLLDEEDVLAVVPYIDYGYEDGLGDFRNAAGRLAVACGEDIIDEALYFEPVQARSRGFTGDRRPDASGNDDLNLWCNATTELDAESFGTPGESNDICVGTGGPISCIEDGQVRTARAPVLGDVVITEIMSDPSAVSDDDGEWVEILVNVDIDLNGLSLGEELDLSDATVLAGNECVPVAAGTRIVLARSDDPAVNGGLPRVDALFDFALNQSDNDVVLSYGPQVLDSRHYGSSTAGVAHNLDPDYENPDDNDDPLYWCRATSAYGSGDLGTPGEPNVECDIPAPEGQCLDGDTFRDIVPPSPGELVIAELMANPEAAAEEGQSEWFELLADGEFDLNGVVLGTVEGEVRSTLEATECLHLLPGDLAVVAREEDPALNGGLPVVHARFDFSLVNSSGTLWVGTDAGTLDLVTWASVPAGASRALDPSAADPTSNDDDLVWCAGTEPYGDGDLGTPGSPNAACGGTPSGTCNDGGVSRDTVPPQAGDLVITELLPDPSAVADAQGEWFEVLVRADVDLNGLQLGDDPAAPDVTLPAGGDCIAITAGTRVIFAREADPLLNGGLPAVTGTFSFGLTNGGDVLFVGIGGEVLDQITWTGSTPGAALSLDPGAEDPLANDDPTAFCNATTPYGAGDLGTPGAQGAACGGGGGGGLCLDGGVPRAPVAPQLGDLVITEVMPDPSAVADASGEWFEVLVNANVDLNGLQLGDDPLAVDVTLPAGGDCIAVTAGQRVIFARSADPLVNGGLPSVIATFGFGLVNGGDDLFVGIGGTVLDQMSWTGSTPGASLSLDAGAQTTVGNDDPANFCNGSTPYGAGDLGTPAAINPAC